MAILDQPFWCNGENSKSFILRSNEKLLTRKKQQKIQRRFFWYLGLGQICKTM